MLFGLHLNAFVRCFEVKRQGDPTTESVVTAEGAMHVQVGRQADFFWDSACNVGVADCAVED